MAIKLGFTGMDSATEKALADAFQQAIGRSGAQVVLTPHANADVVVVDMDSLYGPMSWMQLHNAGRKVVGYTNAQRSQTDFVLTRPFSVESIAALLPQLGAQPASGAPSRFDNGPVQQAELVEITSEEAHVADHAPVAPVSPPTALGPNTQAPQMASAPVPEDTLRSIATPATEESAPPPAPTPMPTQPLRDPMFADWVRPGRLHGLSRYQRGEGPAVYVDPGAGRYYGPAALKPLEAYFSGKVGETDFTPVSEGDWHAHAMSQGEAQPLTRLMWFGGLLEGGGQLLPQYDPQGRFKLNKWLQTEREFPRHFRISTAMMKGPAMLADIAAAASVPISEVNDFVNAGLAAGLVEPVLPEPEPADAGQARGGLFGRKRGR